MLIVVVVVPESVWGRGLSIGIFANLVWISRRPSTRKHLCVCFVKMQIFNICRDLQRFANICKDLQTFARTCGGSPPRRGSSAKIVSQSFPSGGEERPGGLAETAFWEAHAAIRRDLQGFAGICEDLQGFANGFAPDSRENQVWGARKRSERLR